jgi:hypothetical protein
MSLIPAHILQLVLSFLLHFAQMQEAELCLEPPSNQSKNLFYFIGTEKFSENLTYQCQRALMETYFSPLSHAQPKFVHNSDGRVRLFNKPKNGMKLSHNKTQV